MTKLRVLDLFSGIGGFSLGLERTGGFETVAFCEIDAFADKVLAKHWPTVDCYDDVRIITKERLEEDGIGRIDVITGGYPCQPFSVAGKRKGDQDDRHLWPEMYRIISEVRPAWVIAENVAGHINMGLDQVLSDLEVENYAATAVVIPACAVDAPHRRDRVWIIANDDRQQRGADEGKSDTGTDRRHDIGRVCENVADAGHDAERPSKTMDGNATIGREGITDPANSGEAVADTDQARLQEREGENTVGTWPQCWPVSERGKLWLPEPGVGRVANGIPRRVDRLKGLGNAVVPQIPEMIGRAILTYLEGK